MANPASERTWWKDGTVYQIYPSSYKDSNGDGLGDLPGIVSKLDYIKSLGVDIIWISPMYDSPQVDMGYDISDYEGVYPPFGTVADMDTLIQETHARGMKILLDLVINHSSNQHKWFKESRSSKSNPKRDWYIWRPAKYDGNGKRMPPNNWRSCFSQPAWTWDEHTQEYYLHLFCPEQPDLNWENPTTRKAIHASAIEFWLKKGVDGFRVDTVNMYSKGELKDAPVTDPNHDHQPAGDIFCNGPRMHEFLREMHNDVLKKYGDVMMVGELPCTHDQDHVLRYVSSDDPQLSCVFQFTIVDLGTGGPGGKGKYDWYPYTLSHFKSLNKQLQQFTAGTKGWGTAFLENHDQGRSVSRFASDAPEYRVYSAKMLATMLATMTGTLFLYQGQEIGMINMPESCPISEYPDVESSNYVKLMQSQHPSGIPPSEMKKMRHALQLLARDHARIPMQWDASPDAGFSTPGASKKPWMRVHDAYKEINVAVEDEDPGSVLNFWRAMLRLRKEKIELFGHGYFEPVDEGNEKTFVYSKTAGRERAVVALNFTAEEEEWEAPGGLNGDVECIVCNYEGKPEISQPLRAYESRVYLMKA